MSRSRCIISTIPILGLSSGGVRISGICRTVSRIMRGPARAALLATVLYEAGGRTASAPVTAATEQTSPLIVAANSRSAQDGPWTGGLWTIDLRNHRSRLVAAAPGATFNAPVRSPDGRRLAYVQDGRILWQVDADGRHPRQLYALPSRTFLRVSGPRYTPEGIWLGFTAGCCGNFAIYRIRTDGSRLQQLSRGGVRFLQDWSPDGTHMLFTLDARLWTAGIDGTRAHALGGDLPDAGSFFTARYSPDGSHVVASLLPAEGGSEGGNRAIVIMHPDGRYLTDLTSTFTADATLPTWSPDGKAIAFVTASGAFDAAGRLHDLWMMRYDGRRRTNLTRGTLGDVQAATWGR